jgi:antitoxin PrlF
MVLAQSKVTAQGQISVPAEVRRKLGIGPGSVLEWDEQSGQVIVRKAARHTPKDVHAALFGAQAPPERPLDVEDGIRRHIRKRHARG